jgi:hypothetical protein
MAGCYEHSNESSVVTEGSVILNKCAKISFTEKLYMKSVTWVILKAMYV